MGKKGRKNSKPAKGKVGSKKDEKIKAEKGLNLDPDLLAELNKGLEDCFRFKNGDVYVGQYQVTAEGGVVRHGKGRYFTADKCTFHGTWENDVLKEAERITYPDGSWYQGRLEDGGYVDGGKYSVPHLGELECTFSQKRPSGLVTLTDIDGGIWQGRTDENSVRLLPRNHFFDSEDTYFRLQTEAKKSSLGKSSIDIAAENAAEEAARAAREAAAAEGAARAAADELASAERAADEAAAKAAAAQAIADKLAAEVEASRNAAEAAAERADVAKTNAAVASAKAAESAAAKLMRKTNLSKRRSNMSEMRNE